jgi:hypothetical protein
MLKMIKGCKINDSEQLHEQYELNNSVITANVNADRIQDVLQHFIDLQESLFFFIIELPSNENDELRLRRNNYDPMHKDIYYIDGLNKEAASNLITSYGELLINDGLSSFGIGLLDNTAEIMVRKYNVVTLWSNNIEKYSGFFEEHYINRTGQLITAWDTFNEDNPGECFLFEVDGKNVYSLVNELKDWGIYFAERREE